MKPEVLIDGVRYVPATEATPSTDSIARGLLRQWWGRNCPDEELHRLMNSNYVRVYVNDNGEGPTLASVLGDIAEELPGLGKAGGAGENSG